MVFKMVNTYLNGISRVAAHCGKKEGRHNEGKLDRNGKLLRFNRERKASAIQLMSDDGERLANAENCLRVGNAA